MATARGSRRNDARIGLALAGGGPEGAVYEIGALRALEEALDGLDPNALSVYVGVSAGAFVAACLANGLTTAQMCRAIVSQEPAEHPFQPSMFFTPALREVLRRGMTLPGHLVRAVTDYIKHPEDLTLLESLLTLSRALPVGIFDNDPIRRYLERVFSVRGRTDDFRQLRSKLTVVAADLCLAEPACFGAAGLDHVPISRAVQASTAFPGLYPPVEIDGRFFVDGVLLKTMHGSFALDRGVTLLIAINPIVPVEVDHRIDRRAFAGRSMLERGLPTVLSQTFRTLIHSRMSLGWAMYPSRYPAAKVLLFEPDRVDMHMFTTNIFSFSERKSVLEYAYRSTRRALRRRRADLEPALARHGIGYRWDVLDGERDLWTGIGLSPRRKTPVTTKLERALDRLEAVLDGI